MRPLLKKRVTKKVGGEDIVVGFSTAGNRHIYSDTFGRAKGLKKDDLKNIDKALAKAAYVKFRNAVLTRLSQWCGFYVGGFR